VVWDAGAPWTFQLRVDQTRDGWRIDGEFVRGDDRVPLADADLLSDSLLWIRGTLALMAPVDLVVVNEMKAAAPVDVPEIERPRLSQLLARLGLPAERIPEPLRIEVVDVPPIPVVRLRRPDLSQYDAKLAGDLSFDYGGSMAPSAGGDMFFDDRRQVTVRRRPADEDAAAAQLKAAGVDVSWDAYQRRPRLALPARRFAAIATDLLAQGWRIEAEGKIYRPAHSMRLSVSSGIDWFDLQGTIRFGDDQASLVDVLAALSRGEQTIVLGDGTVGLLPEHWLRRYLPLAAAGHTTGDALRFRQAQAALLDALLDQQDATHAAIAVDATFQRVRDELSRLDELTAVDPPPSFTGVLRDYQRGGLAWLQFLARAGVGGCLADDMGLGKTVMVLALLAWRQEPSLLDPTPARPSLIVVPRSLVHNWMAEAARFAPSLRVLDFSSGKRSASPERFTGFDVILSTYGTLRQDIVHLKDIEFDYVILDEAQDVKNPATKRARALRQLSARRRLAMTGTPIENHLGELWSIFEFLNPGLLGQSAVFQRATSAASFDPDAIALLGRGLRPFILRRTKGQVARELPAKTEQTLLCELSPRERTFYDGLRRHYRASVLDHVKRVGLKRSQMHILEALLRLRQAACHPGLVDAAKLGSSSAKLDVLIPRLAEVIAEGHKALVFSQFTSLLAIVREQLDKDGVTYEYLDGRTRDRQTPVERFQSDPACQLFLISLKAGGVGLNLTAAEYVFLLDPWWNPAVETQAIDRTHRIGQTREVFAYRLIAAGTIEEKVLELQRTKRDLADAILSPAQSGLRHLQQEDLDVLLS
jgi:superfamily II DNA or RNA helicase